MILNLIFSHKFNVPGEDRDIFLTTPNGNAIVYKLRAYRKRSVEVEVGGRHILEVTRSLRVVKMGQGSSGSRHVSARIDLNITYYYCIYPIEFELCRIVGSTTWPLKWIYFSEVYSYHTLWYFYFSSSSLNNCDWSYIYLYNFRS